MSRSLIRLCVFLVAVAAAGCTPQSELVSFPDEMIAAADALDDAFVAAFNAGDADAMTALFWNDPDVMSFPPDALVVRGFEEVGAANAAFVAGTQGSTLELTERHQLPIGEAVLGYGLFTLTMPATDGGEPTEIVGRYTDLKAQRDGSWVYLVDHASVPPPGEPEPEAEAEAEAEGEAASDEESEAEPEPAAN